MNMIRLLADVDMNSVLNNGMSFPERLMEFGKMLLIGMACVFSVIFVIWLMLTVFKLFIYDIPNMKNKKEAEAKAVQAPKAKTAPAPVSTASIPNIPPVSADDDTVTVAVITAAISAYLASNSEDGSVLPFRVVSFKRKKSGTPWNS